MKLRLLLLPLLLVSGLGLSACGSSSSSSSVDTNSTSYKMGYRTGGEGGGLGVNASNWCDFSQRGDGGNEQDWVAGCTQGLRDSQ
jgi:hypothetical protein